METRKELEKKLAKEFWDKVNSYIRTSGKTQKSFSNECGFADRRVESLIAGDRFPDFLECKSIADVMQVPVEYLVYGIVSDKEPLSKKEKLLISNFRKTLPQLQDVLLSHSEALSGVTSQPIQPPSE